MDKKQAVYLVARMDKIRVVSSVVSSVAYSDIYLVESKASKMAALMDAQWAPEMAVLMADKTGETKAAKTVVSRDKKMAYKRVATTVATKEKKTVAKRA